ncbi:MAG: hypothetical protein HKN45_01365 [Flavobacteriales bacterium]|nr:hypothetical protein [Flavobacteriales bacterium]
MEFTLRTLISAPAKAIYSAYLNSKGHSAMTGGEAHISDTLGDRFTAWDGYIEGKNLILEPSNRIVQSWRTSQFKEDENDSTVEILLVEKDGKTELTLIHSGLSDNGEHYKEGWENHYFQPMRAYFSR